MKKTALNRNIILLLFLFFALFSFLFITKDKAISHPNETLTLNPLVAHAGGHIYGFRYTNSLQALEKSYNNGFKLIELDFEWTLDNNVVLIHDWGPMVRRLFMTDEKVFTLKEFKNNKTFQNLNLLDLNDLTKWLEKHPDVYIVTDAKTRNIEFLKLITENYNHIQNQIIPQIYSFDEYTPVKDMGYENIILTLYKLNTSNEDVLNFAENNPIFAVTMPLEQGSSELPSMLKNINVKTYVHTINDLSIFEQLQKNGVFGIYTDYFESNYWIE